ncbi:MAG: hypothetical protein LC645_02190 [Geobacteraceae bacterium]|nr:hypothetical protein [Geobacteraceae bacterium]
MVKTLRKSLSLFVLSAFLLVGFGEQVHALVLCFAADGHSATEKENNGHWAEKHSETCPDAGQGSAEEGSIQGENPDSCLHFCPSFCGESVRKAQPSSPAALSLPTTCFVGFHADNLIAPKLSLSNIPPPYQSAAILRSTILLI